MKLPRRQLIAGGAALGLAGCGGSKFRTYDGPEVTRIQVFKDDRSMFLLHDRNILEGYRIRLGFTARGPKQFEGDGKTPEGAYLIDFRNPRSSYHLSLRVSYPNARDREFAASQDKRPGGDIFIHGAPNTETDRARARRSKDWTAGCIAVRDREMEKIYAMVRVGTPIDIFP